MDDAQRLRAAVERHLHMLAVEIGPRPAGSPANRRATDYVASVLAEAGFAVRALRFSTRWWDPGPGSIELADGTKIEVVPNPFSPPVDVTAAVARVQAREELPHAPTGRVLVLAEQVVPDTVWPAAFPFVQDDEQRALVRTLEARAPAAVVTVSRRAASLPTFEDPELSFGSVTLAPEAAARLRTDDRVRIRLGGAVHAGHGATIATVPRTRHGRVVLSAHVDAKVTTPGAFDNAASVATVLALAETRPEALGSTEVVCFNGEDHFDACGEQAWLAATDLSEVARNVNLDGVGVRGRRTGVATFGCPPGVEQAVDALLEDERHWLRMSPWFESDHAVFAMAGVPAVAVTSEHVHDLLTSVAHTPSDVPAIVDPQVLVRVAGALPGLLTGG